MRIFIAEDEPLAAQKLVLFLQKLGERAEDLHHYGDGKLLLLALQTEQKPDVLFLDIQMPELTGLEVMEQLRNNPEQTDTKIIITSAYDQYAIDGFNYGVTDYLLKPFTLDRLRQAMSKVTVEPTLSIRCEGRTERFKVSDIVCLVSNKDYTCFTLVDNRNLMTIGTLSGFEQQLPESAFARVQRSYIVGLRHVQSYNSQSVTLVNGDNVPLGKTYRDAFLTAIDNFR